MIWGSILTGLSMPGFYHVAAVPEYRRAFATDPRAVIRSSPLPPDRLARQRVGQRHPEVVGGVGGQRQCPEAVGVAAVVAVGVEADVVRRRYHLPHRMKVLAD